MHALPQYCVKYPVYLHLLSSWAAENMQEPRVWPKPSREAYLYGYQ